MTLNRKNTLLSAVWVQMDDERWIRISIVFISFEHSNGVSCFKWLKNAIKLPFWRNSVTSPNLTGDRRKKFSSLGQLNGMSFKRNYQVEMMVEWPQLDRKLIYFSFALTFHMWQQRQSKWNRMMSNGLKQKNILIIKNIKNQKKKIM